MNDVILVTGASRGIGAATVRRFCALGYSVLAAARSQERLEALSAETGCAFLAGDIGDESFVRRLFAEAERLGRLKAVVNNAGISWVGLLQDMTLAEWEESFRTNVTGMFLSARQAIPLLKDEGGAIVNVSSVWGRVGASCEVAYSATKGAVDAFTRALARELAPSGIRVNAVAPGAIDTDMNAHLSAEDRRALEEEIGMGRYGTSAEVADLIADLALNHPYLTGQVVTLDGGWQ